MSDAAGVSDIGEELLLFEYPPMIERGGVPDRYCDMVDGGKVQIFDAENDDAWITSDVALDRGGMQ